MNIGSWPKSRVHAALHVGRSVIRNTPPLAPHRRAAPTPDVTIVRAYARYIKAALTSRAEPRAVYSDWSHLNVFETMLSHKECNTAWKLCWRAAFSCRTTCECGLDVTTRGGLDQSLSRWQTNDKIGQFYWPIFSVKLEPSFTAEFVADKIGQFYRLCVVQKSANFLLCDIICLFYRPILSFVCHRL